MKSALKARLALFAVLALGACGSTNTGGGGGADGSAGGGGHTNMMMGGTCLQTTACPSGATLTGRVLAPNGVDPVVGAAVYVPTEERNFSTGVSCDVCSQVFPSCTTVTSGSDGSFELYGVPVGTQQVHITKGRFRRKLELEVSCGITALTAEQTSLPRNASQGDLPKIAVANGVWDKLECVLVKMGIDPLAIDIYNNVIDFAEQGKATFESLLRDLPLLKSYNVVVINCTPQDMQQYLSDATIKSNIEAYAASGGRLYVTDLAYNFVEQVPEFSPFICFHPTDVCGDAPEAMGAAELGQDTYLSGSATPGTVLDPTLKGWLSVLGVLSEDTVPIHDLALGWAMQKSFQAPAKGWIEGLVYSENIQNAPRIDGVYPLTVTFEYNQCGRVLFTSYHTHGRWGDTCGSSGTPCHFPDYCDSNALTPQERILEYLVFEIANCVGSPG